MFEQATKTKLRFKVANGLISTEDLWSLSLESLDDIARGVAKEIKDSEEVSFIRNTSSTDKKAELRLNILKHIIGVKLAEAEVKKDKQAKAERKAAILKILATKQDAELQAKSTDELIKELEALE